MENGFIEFKFEEVKFLCFFEYKKENINLI